MIQPVATVPKQVSEVAIEGFRLYKRTYLSVFGLAFVTALIGAIPQISLLIRGEQPDKIALTAAFLVVEILIILVSTFLVATIMHRIYGVMHQRETSLNQSCHFVANKYHLILASFFLVIIADMIGYILFIVPGIIISIFFFFNIPSILFDGKGPVDAIVQSAQLVWGHWWRTFIIMLYPILLMMIASILVYMVLSAHYPIVQLILNVLISTALLPLFESFLLVQFDDLKVRAIQKTQ